MKILKPTTEPIPARSNPVYSVVWDMAILLKPGEVLPVEFDTIRDARKLQSAAYTKKTILTVSVRGNIAYVKKL